MQIICTSLQTDNHISTPSPNFYGLHALSAAKPSQSIKALKALIKALKNDENIFICKEAEKESYTQNYLPINSIWKKCI